MTRLITEYLLPCHRQFIYQALQNFVNSSAAVQIGIISVETKVVAYLFSFYVIRQMLR